MDDDLEDNLDSGDSAQECAEFDAEAMRAAVVAACRVAGMAATADAITLCIRLAGDEAVQALNSQWRGKDRVTDVLSFPMQEPPIDLREPLGDIALAYPFVWQEAARLALTPAAHLVHLVVHATLHLLGYDHIDDAEALTMQRLEQQAMRQLGLHNPYPDLMREPPACS